MMNRIKEILKQQGRTQTWLSRRLDIPFRIVNSWANNHHQPSENKLYLIAQKLNVNVRDLTKQDESDYSGQQGV